MCVGEGFNDLPMFEEADIGIAYGGVHPPAKSPTDTFQDFHVFGRESFPPILRFEPESVALEQNR